VLAKEVHKSSISSISVLQEAYLLHQAAAQSWTPNCDVQTSFRTAPATPQWNLTEITMHNLYPAEFHQCVCAASWFKHPF
jgi:hypothetical protein